MSRRTAIWLPVAVAAVLRGSAVWDPYPGIELQGVYGGAAVAVAREMWVPPMLQHGSALFDLLRALTTLWYGVGRALSLYHDRTDLLAAYLRNPEPFHSASRAIVCALCVAAVYLVGRIGADRFGDGVGFVAGLLLAVSFIHVRESLSVWPDGPAASAVVLTVAAALAAQRRPSLARFTIAGACAGLAVATKHSSLPAVLCVAVAAACAPVAGFRQLAVRTLAGAVASGATYVVLSPYAVLLAGDIWIQLAGAPQVMLAGSPVPGTSSLSTLLPVTIGWVPCAFAAVGLLAAAPRDLAATVLVATFPLLYAAILARATGLLYARYFVFLAPFVALFAAHGIVSLARRVSPRHPRLAVAALTVAVAIGPAVQSVRYLQVRRREDTRYVAGAWIVEHVPPGMPLTLPNRLGHANPVLPVTRETLGRTFAGFDLLERGLAERSYPARFLGMAGMVRPGLPTTQLVVTATLPVELPGLTPPAVVERLRAAGAQPIVAFESVPTPLPAGVVYDLRDADYIPLVGTEHLLRPGPNLTVWRMPNPPRPRAPAPRAPRAPVS